MILRLFTRCEHKNVRCIHGDEIISTVRAWRRPTLARVRCLDCGKALYNKPFPIMCYNTGFRHFSFEGKGVS